MKDWQKEIQPKLEKLNELTTEILNQLPKVEPETDVIDKIRSACFDGSPHSINICMKKYASHILSEAIRKTELYMSDKCVVSTTDEAIKIGMDNALQILKNFQKDLQ